MRFTIVILSALLCLPAWAEAPVADEKSDAALEAAAEQLIAENDKAVEGAAVVPPSAEAAKTLKESEIPLVLPTVKSAKSESGMIWRLVGSLAVLAVLAGAVTYAARRWRRQQDKGGQKARIEVMHQLHLGPRKSVALIRVSGEALLVGITDQNINMLKTVTLIDDELENALGKDFNGFLEDEFSIEDVRNAIGPRV